MNKSMPNQQHRCLLVQIINLLFLIAAAAGLGVAAEPPARQGSLITGSTSGLQAAIFTPPRFTPPANVVVILPGTDIQSIVDQHPAGTAFLLKAGIHQLQSITPKNGMSFYGEVDKDGRLLTTLNGANLITKFEREGRLWVITGQTQNGNHTAYAQEKKGIWARYGGMDVMAGWEGTTYCEDVFLDNRHLRHVGGAGLRFQWDGAGMKEKFGSTDLHEGLHELRIEFNAIGDTGGAARFNYSHDNGSRGIGIQLANKVVAEYSELAFNNRLH